MAFEEREDPVQGRVDPGLAAGCDLDDESWYVIRNTPGIVNFVGQGGKPSPLMRREVETFLQVKVEGREAAPTKRGKARLEYETGETELYDLDRDPFELANVTGDHAHAALKAWMAARLHALQTE